MDTITTKQHILRTIKLMPVYAISLSLLFMPLLESKLASIRINQRLVSAQAIEADAQEKIIEGTPKELLIEDIGLQIELISGGTNPNGEWILTEDNVHFATQTALPNNRRGNTVLYGHNRDRVLGRTAGLGLGDKAIIATQEGYSFVYKYSGDSIVKPQDTQVLDYSSKPKLTLITCSGFMSQERRIMEFEFDQVKRIGK